MGLEKYLEEGEEIICKVRRAWGLVLIFSFVGFFIIKSILDGEGDVKWLIFMLLISILIIIDYFYSVIALTNERVIIRSFGTLWKIKSILLDDIENVYPGGGHGGISVEIKLNNGKHESFSNGAGGSTIYQDFRNLKGE